MKNDSDAHIIVPQKRTGDVSICQAYMKTELLNFEYEIILLKLTGTDELIIPRQKPACIAAAKTWDKMWVLHVNIWLCESVGLIRTYKDTGHSTCATQYVNVEPPGKYSLTYWYRGGICAGMWLL